MLLPLLLCSFLILSYTNSAHVVVVVQLPSPVWSFANTWTAACPGLPVPHQLLEFALPKFMSLESVLPSNYLILCSSLLLLPSILLIGVNINHQFYMSSNKAQWGYYLISIRYIWLSNQFLVRNIMETNPHKTNISSFSSY